MNNNINFKGVFWLKQPNDIVKKDILQTLGRHRQIFNDFTPEGDVLYVTRKGADKNVAKFLTEINKRTKNSTKSSTKTEFRYYPDLSTKSGFDDEMPDEARNILKSYKSKIVTTVAELKRMFKIHSSAELQQNTSKSENSIEKTLKAIDIDIQDHIVKHRNGFTEIYTKAPSAKDQRLVASISDPGRYGFRYARVEPKNPNDPKDEVKRYAIKDGKKEFTYVNNPDENIANGTSVFLKNYLTAVRNNRTITHNAKHQ